MAKPRIPFGRDPDVQLVADLALALHGCDTNAARLEETVVRAGRGLGLEVECFASPTALFLGVGEAPARMLRVEPADFDGEALVTLDGIARDIEAGTLRPRAARRRLAALKRRPAPGSLVLLAAFAVVSASAAVLFGAGAVEAGAAAGLGMLAASMLSVAGAHASASRLAPLLVAGLVALTATALTVGLPLSPERATLAALIVLIPGLSLTLALADLSEGHLVAGTARMAAVATTFLQLGLGAALGWSLLDARGAVVDGSSATAEIVALAASPVAIGVLMRVRRRDLPAMALATWIGVGTARIVGEAAGAEMGAFAGALAVGLGSNLYARCGVPSPVVMVPGILLLVPGGVGFRGFAALVESHTLQGLEAAFSAVLVAASLVAGLLVAHAVLPEARAPSSPRG